jgi:hypothetical protein
MFRFMARKGVIGEAGYGLVCTVIVVWFGMFGYCGEANTLSTVINLEQLLYLTCKLSTNLSG